MEGEVIFYIAGKTAANETQLKKSLADINITISNVCFATDVRKFVKLLTTAVSRSKLIFIIGGLTDFSDNNIIRVLSKALSIKLKDGDLPLLEGVCTLENSWGANGSFLESGIQSICVLPDEPKQISIIMKNQLKTILARKYNLPMKNCKSPDEDFLKNVSNDLIFDLQIEAEKNAPSLSLEQIKDILPEDINRELFGKTNQESSYDKSAKISPNLNPDILEDINKNKDINETVGNKKSGNRFSAEQDNINDELILDDLNLNNFCESMEIEKNIDCKGKNVAVFEDPDIELSTIDLEAENKKRLKMKLNSKAQDIISADDKDSNDDNTSKTPQSVGSLEDVLFTTSERGINRDVEKESHDNNTNDDINNIKSASVNNKVAFKNTVLDGDNYNNLEDEQLLAQSIRKSKSSTLIDALLVMLILISIGCAVYIYYKVFLG